MSSEANEILAESDKLELPTVTIVGRPNVGKSTFFNKLTGTRKSIVGDLPGITRDRIYGTVEWNNRMFRLVDTGGIIPDDEATIPKNILIQAKTAIEESGLILLMVDARAGITSLDEELAAMLRPLGKKVFVVGNKADAASIEDHAQEFHSLGFDGVFPVSSEHGNGIGDLLDAILDSIELPEARETKTEEIKLAIIGRPNVGKSSLVNKLLGQDRVIVSPIAGTTRDSIDTQLEYEGQKFLLVDTAGIRRKGKTEGMAEKLSVVMARKNIERADVAIIIIDGEEGPTNLDATIAGYAHEEGKSIIIAVNKWDLVEKDSHTMTAYERKVREGMKYLDYAPIVFISALTGQRIHNLLDLAIKAQQARHFRISTAELNVFFEQHLDQPKATLPGKQQMRVRYITQAGICPPTFVLFTNAKKYKLHFSYERYITNRLREQFDFFATPIRIVQRNRKA
ncbi:MAG TPA: ribosome biogenesis GTPase Der [Blastocatellia bacterium]|nr:ribosome biogenesis GTPase Der [Blastocatellia bacterium]